MRVNGEVINSLKQLGEDEGDNVLAELIDLYLEDAPVCLGRLRMAVQEKNTAELKSAAHSLKGSSGNLGAEDLMHLCSDLESAAKQGNIISAAQVFGKVEVEFAEVKAILLTHRAA